MVDGHSGSLTGLVMVAVCVGGALLEEETSAYNLPSVLALAFSSQPTKLLACLQPLAPIATMPVSLHG